jgi:hypothetical protein
MSQKVISHNQLLVYVKYFHIFALLLVMNQQDIKHYLSIKKGLKPQGAHHTNRGVF